MITFADRLRERQGGARRAPLPPSPAPLHPASDREVRQVLRGTGCQDGPEAAGACDYSRIPPIVGEVLRSPGEPLDAATRSDMELGFGGSFGRVRIHTDNRAADAARSVYAQAFTFGEDIVFGAGRFAPGTSAGKQLLAHELVHVIQQQTLPAPRLQRLGEDAPATGQPVMAEPTEADYREFLQEAIRFLEAFRDYYRVVGAPPRIGIPSGSAGQQSQATEQVPPGEAPTQAQVGQAPAVAATAGAQIPVHAPAAGAGTGARGGIPARVLTLERVATLLENLQSVYDNARNILTSHLAEDAETANSLRSAYSDAVVALREAARSADAPRVNFTLIAAPHVPGDEFITNAADYARTYYGNPPPDDTLVSAQNIDSPAALFDRVETGQPERMIRRIDIFAHGTIEPTHQIRFGDSWYRVGDLEAEAANRAYASGHIQNLTRFDTISGIELHACRLGAATSLPGATGEAPTSGAEFLTGLGTALGGQHDQEVSGYSQRWVPRRFEISWTYAGGLDLPVRNTKADVYDQNSLPVRNGQPQDHDPFITRFENYAVQVFDAALAGSFEVQQFLSDAERGGAEVTRDRKITIMRAIYDANGAWLLGFQYSTAQPGCVDPASCVPAPQSTFTREAGWTNLVLRVRVRQPSAAPVP